MKKFVLARLLGLALALGVVAFIDTAARADAPLVTATGTIVSRVDEVLVVRTADRGDLTFDLDKSTEMPASLPVGSWITVWYDSDDKVTDKMDARKIVMAAAPTTSAPAPSTPVVTTPAPTPAPTPSQETRTSYGSNDDELPATASPLALMGLVGLLTLAGGYVLRKRAQRS